MTTPAESVSRKQAASPESMRAIVQDRYGSPDVLELRMVPVPEPGDDEALVQIRSAGVNPADYHMITGTPYLVRLMNGLRRPKAAVPGMDIAGVVTAVGPNVKGVKVGDRVFGESGGGYAEYAVAPERRLAVMPDAMSFEQAAATPIAAITALQAVRDNAGVGKDDHVLIIGASGGVGTFAVQIAKALGARVTAVCSTKNIELVESIGADAVVDYTTTDVADLSDRFDAIIQTGGDTPIRALRKLMVEDGRLVWVGSSDMGNWLKPVVHMIRLSLASKFRSKKMMGMLAKQTPEDMSTLAEMFVAGDVVPVIDRTYSLSETPDAIRRQGHKHASGKSVIVL